MKKRLFILFCILQSFAFSQSKMVWLHTADKLYADGDYHNALTYYQKVLNDTIALNYAILPYEARLSNRNLSKKKEDKSGKKVTLKTYTEHQIGMCYKNTYDYKRAQKQFASTYKSEGYPDDAYYYGSALKNNQKYDTAITVFEAFIRSGNDSDSLINLAKAAMRGCYYAGNVNSRKEAKVTLADSVFNAGTSSFAVSFFGSEDKVMFTAARPGGVILEPDQKSEFLCDVYWTEKGNNGQWKPATNFGRPMNSAQNDAASTINNTNTIFYTRWSNAHRRNPKIYLARMMNGQFFEASKLDGRVNLPGYISKQPFVSMDGKTLYFSSNRPGGQGGFDLWKIALDKKGNLKDSAQNLGPTVNSAADEVTPFFHEATSTLFFSSNGYNTLGGFDVFKSAYNVKYNVYGKPSNMGTPINSSYDDTYMIWDSKLKHGFVSSDRAPCDFGHCFHIYNVKNSDIVVSIEGNSYDAETNKILPNTKITIKDVKGVKQNKDIKTDAKGHYKMKISIGEEQFMKATHLHYFADAAVVNTEKITKSTTLHQDFHLRPIPNQEINIEGIEYDFDSDKLRPSSKVVLDTLYNLLKLNDNLVVQINSHTDYKGADNYNLDLSKRRAQSVVNYLVKKGINTKRLIAKGYGEVDPTVWIDKSKQPILDKEGKKIPLTKEFILTLSKKDQDRANQLNRRTAFKVVGQGFKASSANQ